MKREFLQGLGLDGSVIDQIMTENGKDIEGLKSQLTVQKGLVTELQGKVTEQEGKLEEFSKVDVTALTSERDTLKEALKQSKADSVKALEGLKKDYALEGVLGKYKFTSDFARNGIKDMLIKQELEYKDGAFVGVEDAIKNLQETHKDAFIQEQDAKKPQFTSAVQGKSQSVTESEFLAARYANNPYYKQN